MSCSVEYLGYVIATEEWSSKKVEVISLSPHPKELNWVVSFLGLVNYVIWKVYPAVSIYYPVIKSIVV